MLNNLKKSVVLILLFVILTLQVGAKKKAFMRIYVFGSAKNFTGFYSGHTDSAIILHGRKRPDTINYAIIQKIHQGRRKGHYILLSSAIGAIAGTLTGLIAHKEYPPSDPNCVLCPLFEVFETTLAEDAAGGAILGSTVGSLTGLIIGSTQRRLTLIVDGNYANWKKIEKILETFPVYGH